ncbi:type II toxin-antitoxin system RelE/ParE family toxin [Rugamonas apoptosis]|uniref:Type II toxin-antitoxin system RelE/ParE family toxin n=1 Tax=Rugamonas apoptosis TaxID=2758570 RepID=A0A7W2FDJ0_9BURK|nr:type II toxin-antitoxin system RelE/ParE family toxin [Rugamonas apoptosis]MBA5689740.1 type II toxin-antitoxin system RelE/ParE family toxin [Rugamonas apoptosis]
MVRWSLAAAKLLAQTLEHIDTQDPGTALIIMQRVQSALDLIVLHPALGTPTTRPGIRWFAIPKTGHLIEYRAGKTGITVTRWARQARRRKG